MNQPNTPFDESKYAKKVAIHVGSDHHTQSLTSKEYSDLLKKVTYFLEEPVYHGHTPNLLKLFKFARNKLRLFSLEKAKTNYLLDTLGTKYFTISNYFCQYLISLIPHYLNGCFQQRLIEKSKHFLTQTTLILRNVSI